MYDTPVWFDGWDRHGRSWDDLFGVADFQLKPCKWQRAPGWVQSSNQCCFVVTGSFISPCFGLAAFDTVHSCTGMHRNAISDLVKLAEATSQDTTLPETNSSPLNIDPWKRRFLLETTILRGYVMLVLGSVTSKSDILLMAEFLLISHHYSTLPEMNSSPLKNRSSIFQQNQFSELNLLSVKDMRSTTTRWAIGLIHGPINMQLRVFHL